MKLEYVVRHARLNPATAHYVGNSGALRDMPTGARGRPRVFSFGQAFKFAVATRLVMTGVPLRRAVSVVEFCFQELGEEPLTWEAWRKKWAGPGRLLQLHISDDETAHLIWFAWYDKVREACFSISRGERVEIMSDPEPLSHNVIHLTRLATALGFAV